MGSTRRPAGRRSREELKELVLDAAVELLRRDGLAVRPASITYKQVFDHLEQTKGVKVTRGSVHERIWDSQEQFQTEAIERAALWRSASLAGAKDLSFEVLTGITASETTPWDALTAVVHDVAPAAQSAADEDPLYFAWVGMTLSMAAGNTDELTAPMARSVHRSYEDATAMSAKMYADLANAIGLRLRPARFPDPSEGWTLLAKLGMALSEGCTLRTRFDPDELAEVELAPVDGQPPEPWHPFAIGMLALLQFFLEPDDDR